MRRLRPSAAVGLLGLLAALSSLRAAPVPAAPPPAASAAHAPTAKDLELLDAYIAAAWAKLTRTPRDLPTAAIDPKFPAPAGRAPVYLSRLESLPAVQRRLEELLPAPALARIELRTLPAGDGEPAAPGLLYLPRPYVVPGGRFNEMYGWDSYFIVRGLLQNGEVGRALDMVDDALYEVTRFGKVLNANRTYYLERSQPPLLTRMSLAVYAATHDRAWLASTLPAIRAQHRYWVTPPHLAGATGLSRYHALGAGPAREVVASEKDALGRTHYDRVRAALRADALAGRDVAAYYDVRQDRLTPLAYVADRTVRESGFDTSDRFGPFSLGVLDFAPVCLNSLLYAMERDAAAILEELGDAAEARTWSVAAERRARRLRERLWDDGRGLFLDYDFQRGRRRDYPFAATFFPLWVGAATPDEARRLAAAALPLLLRAGGLMTSTSVTGQQWDAPFGWAPLQLLAVEGLRRYGLDADADRVAIAFLGTVLAEFVARGAIFEKYDVERRASNVTPGLRYGYLSNEIGFGWTNGVFVALEAGLGPRARDAVVRAAR
ncbi:MAG TPA: trehalase family glycosidase [Polyangia bacterium]|nr:trehalase family glycosidase [Polyangia bacterium]